MSYPHKADGTFFGWGFPGKETMTYLQKRNYLYRLMLTAMFLALAYVLPLFTGQIPTIGKVLAPMHLPVLLCGFFCGPVFGAALGVIAPITRSLFFGMPALYPKAIYYAAEFATYGFLAGLLYKLLHTKVEAYLSKKAENRKNAAAYKRFFKYLSIYLSLIPAMIGGRIVWGIARFLLTGLNPSAFGFSVFITEGFAESSAGIVLQLILIPILVSALEKQNPVLQIK